MPFDPTLPLNHAKIIAAELRAQFNGIVDLIQTIPVGPQGEPGPPGTSVSGAVVDGVTTANPWEPAAATASFDGANVRFTFTIPRGQDGAQGLQGNSGFDGQQGQPGMQRIQGDVGPVGPAGPPFTSFVIDGVTTLQPGQPVTVGAVFDGANVRLSFGIPQGPQGTAGLDGQPGMQGPQGPAFTSFVVDGVTTLEPWQPATVTASFDGTNVRFTFGIPRGNDGVQGVQGLPGNDGQTGPQGIPGNDGQPARQGRRVRRGRKTSRGLRTIRTAWPHSGWR